MQLGNEKSVSFLSKSNITAYCTLRNEMESMYFIYDTRNLYFFEMENLHFEKWKICTLRNEKSQLCEIKHCLSSLAKTQCNLTLLGLTGYVTTGVIDFMFLVALSKIVEVDLFKTNPVYVKSVTLA